MVGIPTKAAYHTSNPTDVPIQPQSSPPLLPQNCSPLGEETQQLCYCSKYFLPLCGREKKYTGSCLMTVFVLRLNSACPPGEEFYCLTSMTLDIPIWHVLANDAWTEFKSATFKKKKKLECGSALFSFHFAITSEMCVHPQIVS